MSATELMKKAAERMEEAQRKLREVREASFTPGNLKEWMTALTDYALALGEVQEYSQQSLHEKVQALGREVHRPLAPPKRHTG